MTGGPATPRRIGDTPQGGPVQAFYLRKGTERRPPIARGEGIYLWDATGRRYLDASSGPVVSNLGHGNPRVLAAMHAQAAQVTFAYPGLFESEANTALADLICTRPVKLEAYMGDNALQTVPYEPARALEALAFILGIKAGAEEPADAIGWSKCLDCGFNSFVWGRARERRDVALLPSVDGPLPGRSTRRGLIHTRIFPSDTPRRRWLRYASESANEK